MKILKKTMHGCVVWIWICPFRKSLTTKDEKFYPAESENCSSKIDCRRPVLDFESQCFIWNVQTRVSYLVNLNFDNSLMVLIMGLSCFARGQSTCQNDLVVLTLCSHVCSLQCENVPYIWHVKSTWQVCEVPVHIRENLFVVINSFIARSCI